MIKRSSGLRRAVHAAGSYGRLAKLLGIEHRQTVHQWKDVPAERVIQIEKATGVHRAKLRPDLYPPEKKRRSK
jgi:DNA-binding transcriptional regulator YdaS (Cro superfamily)